MSYFTFFDNVLPTFVGSTFRQYRSSATAVGLSGGTNLLPNAFFDTQSHITPDLTYTTTGNKLTVSIAGTYLIDISLGMNAAMGTSEYLRPAVFKNGSMIMQGNGANSGGFISEQTFLVYLGVGDYVQAGYNRTGTPGSPFGDAGGTFTYFSAALVNRSLT